MMENLTISETRIEPKRLKLVGIKNLWMVRVFFEKSSIRPTKRGQRPKLTLEVRSNQSGHLEVRSNHFQGPSPRGLS